MAENKRQYDSSGRLRRAEVRRRAVADAAGRLFAERGYEGTTLADLAEAAAVSVPYLQKLGSKVDLFVLAVESRTIGNQQTFGHFRGDFEQTAATVTRDEYLDLVVEVTADWNAGSSGLWRAWADTADPDLHARWLQVMAGIRADWAEHLARFDDRGWWRTDVPRREQLASVWLLTMAETYQRMTQIAGLSHDDYRAWLRRSITAVLVEPGSGRPLTGD